MSFDFLNVAADVQKEEAKDVLGGRHIFESGIYRAVIKAAYLDKSPRGANNVNFVMEVDGKPFTYVEYITNAKGENFYTDKKTGSKRLMPGMHKLTSLCTLLTGKDIGNQEVETKIHKIWSREAGEATPQQRPTLVGLTDKAVHVGMLKVLENKNVKSGDSYVPTAEIRESNEIDKFFDQAGFTLAEVEASATEPKFLHEWQAKNKGKDKNKVKEVQGGKPMAAAGAPAGGNIDLSFS